MDNGTMNSLEVLHVTTLEASQHSNTTTTHSATAKSAA